MTCGDSSELPVYFFIPFVLVLLSYLWLPLTPSCSPPPLFVYDVKSLKFPRKKKMQNSPYQKATSLAASVSLC